jgi:hypothetical protein
MKRIKITGTKALKAMTAAMDERGEEFKFTDMFEDEIGCFYSGIPKDKFEGYDEDGSPIGEHVPACLVGLAFHLIDPALDEFLSQRDNNAQAISILFGVDRHYVSRMADEAFAECDGLEIVVTKKALMVLTAAQECQDGGGTWGEAVERAIEVVA